MGGTIQHMGEGISILIDILSPILIFENQLCLLIDYNQQSGNHLKPGNIDHIPSESVIIFNLLINL